MRRAPSDEDIWGLGIFPSPGRQESTFRASDREVGWTELLLSVQDSLCLWRTAAAAKSLQSCLTLCGPIDGSPPGSPVPGILRARTLEWVAISFSNAWKGKVKVKSLSRVRPSATPWTAARQAPPSLGFCRQECWSGVLAPPNHYSSATWRVSLQFPFYRWVSWGFKECVWIEQSETAKGWQSWE